MAYYGSNKVQPWAASSMHFNPNKDRPAFQREYKSLNSSGVLVNNAATQTMIKAASSSDYNATHYMWGVIYCTGDSDFAAGHLKDEDDNILVTVMATNKGPMFIAFDTPIKVTENSAIVHHKLAYKANTFCTPLFITTRRKVRG